MVRMFAALALFATALALLGLPVVSGVVTAEEKDKALKLVGGYTVVSGERDGKPEPEDRIKGTTVRFTEDTITVSDKDKKETYVATYKLDSSKKPCSITMTSTVPKDGPTAKGLIEKDGDTIKLIYALPGGELPTEFKTKEKQFLFVLKNLNK